MEVVVLQDTTIEHNEQSSFFFFFYNINCEVRIRTECVKGCNLLGLSCQSSLSQSLLFQCLFVQSLMCQLGLKFKLTEKLRNKGLESCQELTGLNEIYSSVYHQHCFSVETK